MKEIIEDIFQDLEILLLHNEDDFDRGKGKFYIREFLEQKEKYLKQIENNFYNKENVNELLERLLSANLCSVFGDEIIEEFKQNNIGTI